MTQRTPLYHAHLAHGARMVDFAGWEMPIHYGSQIEEHHQVRRAAGIFDVSHMGVVDLEGARVRDFLRYLLANDVARVDGHQGKAIYGCMLNEQGGVIDDLIVYRMGTVWYRMVINAGCRDKDIAWLRRHAASFAVDVDVRSELAMLAVQGPQARDAVHAALGAEAAPARGLGRFEATVEGDLFIARTGYTGEDGYELVLPGERAEQVWGAIVDAGAVPVGLGARDTLRLEAGMNLYGQDMDEHVSPLESALGWTVAWEPEDREFIGRAALAAQRAAGVARRLVGVLLEDKGVLRAHQKVYVDGGEGEVTSGSFSPTLGRAIGFARVPAGKAERCEVDMRGRRVPARILRPPFVRNGKPCVEV